MLTIEKDKNTKFKRGFVSEIDQFLHMLNNLPGAQGNSKIEEEQKYQRIFALRDNVQTSLPEDIAWKEF